MKRVLILGLLVGLSGCKEGSTGLDKNVINTAFDICNTKLKSSLKSPSSLKVKNTSISLDYPNPYQVFRVYTDQLIDSTSGKAYVRTPESKYRFRELKSEIYYEAQNSFGVFLPGQFSCSYIFHISEKYPDPYEMRLAFIVADGSEIMIKDESFVFNDASNFYMRNMNKINILAPLNYTENDKAIINKSVETYYTDKRLKDVRV